MVIFHSYVKLPEGSFYISSLNVKAITFGSATTLTNVAFAAVATVSTHARLWIGGQRQPNITLGWWLQKEQTQQTAAVFAPRFWFLVDVASQFLGYSHISRFETESCHAQMWNCSTPASFSDVKEIVDTCWEV